ncbi:Hypothetical_protein [Hexamita inflata]|uniref:Hypothetical_protein n=1 Tax=Hexamita inflata TaxID=28002 RepID=A0AA86QIK9_9EUKA|nr:Hypothetical protein HINF_LOCUS47809 [Hexamita inflata]
MEFPVLTASLICFLCDIIVYNSSLIFQASGQQVSGVMIESLSTIQLVSTFLQFRFNSSKSSGIANLVNSTLEKFQLITCKISGTNLQSSSENGYVSSSVLISFTLSLDSVQICVNLTQQIGNGSVIITQVGTPEVHCDICLSGSVVYGICLADLQFGQVQNGMLQCVFPFQFFDNLCKCADGYILNVSACINIIDQLNTRKTGDLEEEILKLENNLSDINGKFDINNKQQDNKIYNNITNFNQFISLDNNQLQQLIIDNISQIDSILTSINNSLVNNVDGQFTILKQLQTRIQLLSNNSNCVNATNNSFINDSLYSDNSTNMYKNITINQSYIDTYLYKCNNNIGFDIFDIASVTNSVASADFASGYVFSTANVISNAFIDVQDSVYTAVVQPLFQTQSTFTNIKIQVGTQVVGTGAILSNQSTLVINQMNVISRDGSLITVNSTFKFNVLQQKSTSVVVNNLLLNLTFNQTSVGSIGLFGTVNGTMNLTNYSVVGVYQSSGCVALGAVFVTSSVVFVTNLSFAPSVYNIGNQSSFLISASNTSSIVLDDLSIVLGNMTNPLQFNLVFTNTNYFCQFGGLVTQLNSSTLNVSDLLYNAKQIYKVYYMYNSGLLLGLANKSANNVTIQRICFAQVLKSQTQFSQFGLVGVFEGNITFVDSSILFNLMNSDVFSYVGTIGSVSTLCLFTYTSNLNVSFVVNDNLGSYVSGLIAFHNSPNCTIMNTTVSNSSVSSTSYSAGFIAYCQSVVVIKFSSVVSSNVTSSTYAAGFIAFAYSNITIINCSTQSSLVNTAAAHASAVLGQVQGSSLVNLQNSLILNNSVSANSHASGVISFSDQSVVLNFTLNSVQNCTINATTTYAGGFVGFANSYDLIVISNSSLSNSLVNALSHSSSGFIGYVSSYLVIVLSIVQVQNSTVGSVGGYCVDSWCQINSCQSSVVISEGTITNSSIVSIHLYGGFVDGIMVSSPRSQQQGVLYKCNVLECNGAISVGYRTSTFIVQGSMPYQDNYLNAVKQQNCANFAVSCTVQNDTVSNIYSNITVTDGQISDTLIQCGQPVFAASFDIASVTNSVASADFASGYVFSTANVISNAFIDVQDSVYTAVVQPLFQTQSTFTNIKIQVGTQVVGTGAILSNQSTLVINQMNVISRDGSLITVNSTFKFNVLQQKSTSVIVNNLLLNLTFNQTSVGSIGLFGTVNGTMNLTNYSVVGVYQSSGCVALGAVFVTSSVVFVTNLSFAPSVYNIGNQSSFLISASNTSSIVLDDLSIVLGNMTNPLQFSLVFTNTNYFCQFGGLVTQLNSSTLNVSDLLYNAKQLYKVYYMYNSGLLLGLANKSANNVTIQRICFAQVLKSQTQFSQFGLVGVFEGNITFVDSSILFNLMNSDVFSYVGTIGSVSTLCLFTYTSNLNVSFVVNDNLGSYVSGLIAFHNSPNCTIMNTTVSNSSVSSASYSAGFIAYCQSVVVIKFSSVVSSNVTSGTYAAGFIAFAYSNITIINCSTQSSLVNTAAAHASAVLGQVQGSSLVNLQNSLILNNSISANSHASGVISFSDSSVVLNFTLNSVQNCTINATTTYAGGFVGFANSYDLIVISNSSLSNSYVNALGHSSSGFIGYVSSYLVIVLSIVQVQNSTVGSVSGYSGGFVGQINSQSSVVISEGTITNSSIVSTNSYVGGFVGWYNGIQSKILSSKVYSVNVSCSNNGAISVGYRTSTFIVQGSMPYQDNYLNAVKQQNCANFAVSCTVQNDTVSNIYSNITVTDGQISDTLIQCGQPVFAASFDIASVTNSVASADFASGYVFSTTNVISNAFIDVQDSVYTAVVQPLFQTQSTLHLHQDPGCTQVVGTEPSSPTRARS